MKKTLLQISVLVSLLMLSCNETKKSIITDADMAKVEAEKELATQSPIVKLDKDVHDFGTINEGDKVETEFMITNDGKTDLIISNAKASCGCTVPEWPKEPIKPGSSAPIKVSFDSSGKPGQQNKTVTLTTNTEKGNETFSIKANVIGKAK